MIKNSTHIVTLLQDESMMSDYIFPLVFCNIYKALACKYHIVDVEYKSVYAVCVCASL